MRAHILQHVPFEGPGSIGDWLKSSRTVVAHTLFFEDDSLPAVAEIDLVVAMGGPMSVNDETAYPWLVAEKRFIREAIEAGKAVVGICLGAQLIASALGARVYPNDEKEIGWFPVYGVQATESRQGFPFPVATPAFHWHGETFDLPDGAVHLARSAACVNQAFQFGGNVVALQFHLETTPESARALVENCRDELVPARYVQSEREILAADVARYDAINALMEKVLAFVTREVG
ncbi:MAG: type 1 glutamine amidotransferase [Burkholderiales bacterium]